jgi:hypothetical protein
VLISFFPDFLVIPANPKWSPDNRAERRYQFDARKDVLLTIREIAAILAYGEVQFNKPRYVAGEQRSIATFKVVNAGSDEYKFLLEDEGEIIEVNLNKADVIILHNLLESSIPYLSGFTEAYKTVQFSDEQPNAFGGLDSQVWT